MRKYVFGSIAVLILAGAVGVGIFAWKRYFSSPPENKLPQPSPSNLGAQIVPDTNPFDAKTNPFQDVYTNPFAQ